MASRTAAGKSEPLGETKTGFDASSGEGNNVSVGKAILRRPIPARGRLVENPSRTRGAFAPLLNLKARLARGRHTT